MADAQSLAAPSADVGATGPVGTPRRIVVKFGTNLLTAGSDRLDLEVMSGLVGQVARLHQAGHDVIVVSSGAVAAGRHRLGISRANRKSTAFKQAAAAVGQSRLMDAYDQLFEWHSIIVAQTLLTKADLADRAGYLNARNTLLALLDFRAVSIVNENDVVAVDALAELRFGDNDNLSAMVANLVDADLLVILTDIEGLYTADPRRDPAAALIPRVTAIDDRVMAHAGGVGGERGTGGMLTKLQAARMATASGVAVVIAEGRLPRVLNRIVDGESLGTYFEPTVSKLESRKRWMLSGVAIRGRLVVDPGAAAAVSVSNGSLLPAGVRGVEGDFLRGDVVAVIDKDGRRIACGLANYAAADVARIKGQRSSAIERILGYQHGDEVVHRNNLVVF